MKSRESRMKSLIREYLPIAIAYAVFTLLAFWPAFLNLTTKIIGSEGDAFYFLWYTWWINFAIFNLHTNPYFTHMMFYPIGHSFLASPFPLLNSIVVFPIQAFSLSAAYNFSVLLSYVLSGVFAYALVKYVVNDRHAAFIGGMVFAFSSIHVAHTFAGHLNWTSTEFLPLFVLLFLIMIKEHRYKYSLFAALALYLTIFFGDPEQGILALTFAAVALYFSYFMQRQEKGSAIKALISVLLMLFIFAIIGLPIFLQVWHQLTSGGALLNPYLFGSIGNSVVLSNSLTGFFVPSYYNQIYNPIVGGGSPGALAGFYSVSVDNIFANGSNNYTSIILQDERTSYIGYVVLFLFLYGIYSELKKKMYQRLSFWLGIFLFFVIMSLGPLLRVSTYASGIPAPFLIWMFIPFLNILFEAGRFFFIATIALAVIAAIGISCLYQRFRLDMGKKLLLTAAISVLIFLDCCGVVFPGHDQLLFQNTTIPAGYSMIKGYQQNVSVLLLPTISEDVSNSYGYDIGGSYYPEEEIYYQTLFQKPLFAGVGKENFTQVEHVYLLPLSELGYALEGNTIPDYHYPVAENLTLLNKAMLAHYNVAYVGVLKQAYSRAALSELQAYLGFLFGNPLYNDSSAAIYSTSGALSNLSQPAYFTTGSWIEGGYLCGYTGGNCTSDVSKSWWGDARRNITIVSPGDYALNISFAIRSYSDDRVVNVYLNGGAQPIDRIAASPNLTVQRLRLNVSKGENNLQFDVNSTGLFSYLSYGIANFSAER